MNLTPEQQKLIDEFCRAISHDDPAKQNGTAPTEPTTECEAQDNTIPDGEDVDLTKYSLSIPEALSLYGLRSLTNNHSSPARAAALEAVHKWLDEPETQEKIERERRKEAFFEKWDKPRPKPTAEQIANTKSDLRLALYIVASLNLHGTFEFDVPADCRLSHDDEAPLPILYAVDEVRQAIREAMPILDMVELQWLNEAQDVDD